jgi:chromosome segregation ATPase
MAVLLLASGAIFFISRELSSSRAHAREIATLREEIKDRTEERDELRRNADLLSGGRRALLSERDDWRDQAEAAKKQIGVLERELDELRKKLQAAQRASTGSRDSRPP